MNGLSEELRVLSDQNPDVALILSTYQLIEQVYVGGLKAMGMVGEMETSVTSSAEVTISLSQSQPVIDARGYKP